MSAKDDLSNCLNAVLGDVANVFWVNVKAGDRYLMYPYTLADGSVAFNEVVSIAPHSTDPTKMDVQALDVNGQPVQLYPTKHGYVDVLL